MAVYSLSVCIWYFILAFGKRTCLTTRTLKYSFRSLHGRHHTLIDDYGVYVTQMTSYISKCNQNRGLFFLKYDFRYNTVCIYSSNQTSST